MPFTRALHSRCMRGLHWIYRSEPALDPDALAELLQGAFEERLVRGDERWGARRVVRLILQFEVEFRLGEEPGQYSLMHRVCASEETRARSQARFEAALRALLGEGESP